MILVVQDGILRKTIWILILLSLYVIVTELSHVEPILEKALASHWQDLTDLTGDDELTVERVRLMRKDIAIEGSFDLPPLVRLPAEDQIFVMAFVRCHGSIKQMERTFGVSYPTVKKRLDSIASRFEFVVSEPEPADGRRSEVIAQLDRGEISVEDAVERLSAS